MGVDIRGGAVMASRIFTVLIAAAAMLSACAGGLGQTGERRPPAQAFERQEASKPPEPALKDPAGDASLWKHASHRDLFKDLRAFQVGDLVTVNIVETSKASKKANTKSGRESSIEAGIDNVLGWENKLKYLTSLGNRKVRGSFDNNPMFKASLKNSFDGSGETSRDESMTASITARVIAVEPNGNLLIEGSREVKVNNENQIIILTGVIRPQDISPNNTILSSYISDARIAYSGTGSVSDKQRPGWLTSLIDFVWPF